ncbi:MAG: DUF6585 family protein [Chloroflexota bacterium]
MKIPSTELSIPIPKEIPFNSKPQGKHVLTYVAKQTRLKKALTGLLCAIILDCGIGFLNLTVAVGKITDEDIFTLDLLFVASVVMSCWVVFEWVRWRKRRTEKYELYEDGLIAYQNNIERSYLWWFDLHAYFANRRYGKFTSLVLQMEDGHSYRLDNVFDRPDEIVANGKKLLHALLVQRIVKRIQSGDSVSLGDITLSPKGIHISAKGVGQTINWQEVLSCDEEPITGNVLIWRREPLALVTTRNPVGYRPVLSMVINARKFPNLPTFVEIVRTIGQFNRHEVTTSLPHSANSEAIAALLKSKPLGLFIQGKVMRWRVMKHWLFLAGSVFPLPIIGIIIGWWTEATYSLGTSAYVTASEIGMLGFFWGGVVLFLSFLVFALIQVLNALLNPIRQITEVFQNGLIIHQNDTATVILWSQITQYRLFVPQWPTVTISIQLETIDGKRWRFNQRDSNIIALKDLLIGKPHTLLFNRALNDLQRQKTVAFGPLTATPDGLFYHNRFLPWAEVSPPFSVNLHIVIKGKGRFGWFASMRQDRLPNLYVLVDLIAHMQRNKQQSEYRL